MTNSIKCPNCKVDIDIDNLIKEKLFTQEVEMRDEIENKLKRELTTNLTTEIERKIKKDIEDNLSNDHEVELRQEKEKIKRLERQLNELHKNAKQSSMQEQGEAQELVLRDKLKSIFNEDRFDEVPIGVNGADILQYVLLESGKEAGLIIWESKNTKTWSNDWISKLKQDQKKAKANFAVIATKTLPKDINTFDLVDDVWICAFKFVVPLTKILRSTIKEIFVNDLVVEHRDSLSEKVYNYITSKNFKDRLKTIGERYNQLTVELDKEKKWINKRWKERETYYLSLIEESDYIKTEISQLGILDFGDESLNKLEYKQIE